MNLTDKIRAAQIDAAERVVLRDLAQKERGETYSTGEGPVCPYCGTENSSAGNDYWAEQTGEGEHECHECERAFKFRVDYTTHYYAEPA